LQVQVPSRVPISVGSEEFKTAAVKVQVLPDIVMVGALNAPMDVYNVLGSLEFVKNVM
jgi:hypothetical protein